VGDEVVEVKLGSSDMLFRVHDGGGLAHAATRRLSPPRERGRGHDNVTRKARRLGVAQLRAARLVADNSAPRAFSKGDLSGAS